MHSYKLLSYGGRAVCLIVILQGLLVFAARDAIPNLPDIVIGSLLRSRFDELNQLPEQNRAGSLIDLAALIELRSKTPPDAYFLTFYQRGFAYYAERHFISDLDPRLVDFYRAPTKESAVAVLQRLSVDHVYLPSWSWPTIDRSFIKAIVSDPTLAILVVDRFGYRVYRLRLAEQSS